MHFTAIPGIDKPVARLIQGTVPLTMADLEGSFALLDGVMAAGGTTFDTAHGYNDGDCERILGRWMAERGNREKVVVISKGAHHNRDRRRGTPYAITSSPVRPRPPALRGARGLWEVGGLGGAAAALTLAFRSAAA